MRAGTSCTPSSEQEIASALTFRQGTFITRIDDLTCCRGRSQTLDPVRVRLSNRVRLLVGLLVTALTMSGVALLAAAPAQAATFAPGDIVVTRVGTGTGALSSSATAVFLDEYTPAGVFVQSIAMPTAGSGANRQLTMSGSATSAGALALSSDGHYLTLGGYDAAPGTANVASSSVSRVVARVDGNGGVDTSTTITDAFSGNNVRAAVTDDGSRFWVVGANSGVRLSTLGSSGTSTQINTAVPTNIRTVSIFGG